MKIRRFESRARVKEIRLNYHFYGQKNSFFAVGEEANTIKQSGKNKQNKTHLIVLRSNTLEISPHLTLLCCLLSSPNLTDTFLITIFNVTIKLRRSANCFCTIPKYVMPPFAPASWQLLQLLLHTSGDIFTFQAPLMSQMSRGSLPSRQWSGGLMRLEIRPL